MGECNHPVCYVCSTRLRALYATNNCYMCKSLNHKVTFSTQKQYQVFKEQDVKLGIYFENSNVKLNTLELLKFSCSFTDSKGKCKFIAKDFENLQQHVKKVHSRGFCNLCIQFKKDFAYEFKLYTLKELEQHKIRGDKDKSFKGHPKCEFCEDFYYSKDELFSHLKQKHESCFICKRMGKDVYYQNYANLEVHFSEEHLVCLEKECLERKFVVFENEIDLRDHEIQEHPGKLGKKGRLIDIQFNYSSKSRAASNSSNSSNSNISRKVPRGFGSRLTDCESSRKEIPQTQQLPEPREGSMDFTPTLDTKGRNSNFQVEEVKLEIADSTDLDLLENISNLLGNDNAKHAQFNSIYDAFRNNVVSATEFLTVFMELCVPGNSRSIRDIGKVWKRLSDITTITSRKGKKKGIQIDLSGKSGNSKMLKAWNDYKIKNSSEVTHWNNVSTFATNAQLSVPVSSNNTLVLSRSDIPSKTISNPTWAGRRLQGGNKDSLEEFPNLPSSSKSVPVSRGNTGYGDTKDTVEWKKKGKKKVLLHFG